VRRRRMTRAIERDLCNYRDTERRGKKSAARVHRKEKKGKTSLRAQRSVAGAMPSKGREKTDRREIELRERGREKSPDVLLPESVALRSDVRKRERAGQRVSESQVRREKEGGGRARRIK